MADPDQIRALRAQGLTPKQIARSLGLRPAEVAELVRQHAANEAPIEPRVVECLVSPGWSAGLGLEGEAAAWRELDDGEPSGTRGLVSVLVVKAQGRHRALSACGYLVDVFCLGVKNAIGPKTVAADELTAFRSRYFRSYERTPVSIPFELARALVLGAVDYAGGLGFEPHPDFARARGHLGELPGKSPIVFGDRGRPHFIPGPNDRPAQVINTLRRTVGDGKFLSSDAF